MPDQAIKAANNKRRFIVQSSLNYYRARLLQGTRTSLAGANAHRLAEIADKDLTVTDFTRARCFNNSFHNPLNLLVIDGQLKLYFGQKINDAFPPPIRPRRTIFPSH